ncbi:hypothetical protein [Streptomyces sp. SD31]|uniref:hypothetical protein n=1 Tax=Streptomyces sp. SD31 TaxID=3452208 RepID=UPI003F8C0AC5
MTADEPRSGLPIEFLRTVAAEADSDSPPVRMAVEKARALPPGNARDDLVLALLQGALSDCAPEWMLQAATDSDLRRDDQPSVGSSMSSSMSSSMGSSMRLATIALAHPSCPDTLRAEALRRCSVQQLAAVGRAHCGDVLAQAVVSELQHRGPHKQPMTPELLTEPTVAQVVLREPGLHDAVFFAAVDLLPRFPAFEDESDADDADDADDDSWAQYERYRDARKAWKGMWEHVVTLHTGRHRQLVEWAQDGDALHVIREHLLGTVPWDVEPSLLEELAAEDLAEFHVSELITRLCRMLRDGASEEVTRARFADDLEAVEPGDRERIEDYFSDPVPFRKYGLRAAVTWVKSRADGAWRHILNPAEAKNRYGEPHTWLASEELLARLGRDFAATAVAALLLWEPDPEPGRPRPRDLRWLHTMLLHLPEVSEEVREKARAVVRHIRPRSRGSWERVDYSTQQDDRRLDEIRTAVVRILGDPATAVRKAALGDPEHITVAELSRASGDVLRDYLDRHPGRDDLMEKVLLSFASASHRSPLSFADVLARHSAPQAALLQITRDLRKRLGGGPHLRETWTRRVLALPDRTPELIRALPAWTALTVGGTSYRTAHEAVVSVVLTTLGSDDEAWSRFATSPASHAGPTAWLRLGDVLDAAAKGEAWPKPPSAR